MGRKEELADLSKLAMSGDQAAMASLYEALAPKLHQVFKREVHNNPVLQGRVGPSDLVQSVFKWLGSFKNGPRQLISNIEGVLVTRGRRRLGDYVRMFIGPTRKRSLEKAGEGVPEGLATGGPSPSSEAATLENERILEQAVAKLPAEDQLWIERWSKGEKKTFREMAVEFGTTEDALKKRHGRILDKLLLIFAEVRANGKY